jgi:putative lipoic acid-binding regulatory protein
MNQTPQALFPGKAAVKVFYLEACQIEAPLIEIVKQLFPELKSKQIEKKFSSNKKYVVLTFDLFVEEEITLKELYRLLNSHPDVKMVL